MSAEPMTYDELAARWKIHPRQVRRVCARYRLKAMDLGHKTKRFRPADVDRAEERMAGVNASNPLTKKKGARA